MVINQELLRTLLEAARAPTFAEAARRRRVTPSAISHQLGALQAQLGVPLFERIGRRARLTAAGARLSAELGQAFARVDDALAAARREHEVIAGSVRIGGPGPFSRMWLRPRLIDLLRAHQGLSIDARFELPSVLARRLHDGELDLALLAGEPDAPGLTTRRVYLEEFVAVAAPAYLERHGRPRSARDFAAHAWLVFDADLAMHATFWRAAFGRRAPQPGNLRCRIGSLDELAALAEAGLGMTVLPSYFVVGKRLTTLPSPGRRALSPIHLAWRTGAAETARFVTVRDRLQSL